MTEVVLGDSVYILPIVSHSQTCKKIHQELDL